jgi:hypothetical protein
METKNEKFQRIRDQRLPKALKAIELLGNLASHNYESTPEEQEAMIEQVLHQVDLVALEFGLVKKKAPPAEPEPEIEVVLTEEENLDLITGLGAHIGRAIEDLADNQPEKARERLLKIMAA